MTENEITKNLRDPDRDAESRQEKHEAMLREALSRPDIREMTEVYGDWRERDRLLEPFRSMTARRYSASTSDRCNLEP